MAYRIAQTINDLLADPLIQKVMRADRVEKPCGPCWMGPPAG